MLRSQGLRRKYMCMLSLLALITVSCGIESIIYLTPPTNIHDTSYLDDLSKRYCQFKTADTHNTAKAAGYFQGTEIYYRIYERELDCTGDRAQITRYNTDNPLNAAQYLQDTKRYYRLATTHIQDSKRPLIDSQSSDSDIRFRLQDYGTTDPAILTVNGSSRGTPIRHSGIFNAKRYFVQENISAEDPDVRKASSSGTNTFWYINFYAVSYGYDKSFKPIYSELTALGYIKIPRTP